jgi:hypothetical protein
MNNFLIFKKVEKMNEIGLNQMKDIGADMNDLRSGINWPPANTVDHLHQHFISPASEMSFFKKMIFSTRNPFFTNVI